MQAMFGPFLFQLFSTMTQITKDPNKQRDSSCLLDLFFLNSNGGLMRTLRMPPLRQVVDFFNLRCRATEEPEEQEAKH